MAKLITEHTFHGNITKVFKAISSYDKYIKYLQQVSEIDVMKPTEKGSVCKVAYKINIIKEIFYTLNMYHDEPNKIWWELDESNLMKKNSGSWEFKKRSDNETIAIHTIDVDIKGFVPRSLLDKVSKAQIPAMMESMQKLIDATT